MAWRSHGATNMELVQNMYKNGLIKSEEVNETYNTYFFLLICSKTRKHTHTGLVNLVTY